VMDAMRLGLSMIVVPNNSLLDNHQDELAKELHSQNYATRATTQ
jgi:beta-1,4-N-acetylglucosaminyltransferase